MFGVIYTICSFLPGSLLWYYFMFYVKEMCWHDPMKLLQILSLETIMIKYEQEKIHSRANYMRSKINIYSLILVQK